MFSLNYDINVMTVFDLPLDVTFKIKNIVFC